MYKEKKFKRIFKALLASGSEHKANVFYPLFMVLKNTFTLVYSYI